MRLTVNQEMRRFESCPRSQFDGRIIQRQDGVLIKPSRWFDSSPVTMAGNSAGRGDRSYKPAQLSSILSPATGSDAELERHLAFNQDQEGSSPSAPTMAPYRSRFLNRQP